jgi:hypothetical protein
MLRITNINVTAEAAPILWQMRGSVQLRPNDLFALVYMSKFTNPEGVTVPGFVPGYVAYPDPLRNPSSTWVLAHLPNGFEFCFIPKARWDAGQSYAVDIASRSVRTLAIGPQEKR